MTRPTGRFVSRIALAAASTASSKLGRLTSRYGPIRARSRSRPSPSGSRRRTGWPTGRGPSPTAAAGRRGGPRLIGHHVQRHLEARPDAPLERVLGHEVTLRARFIANGAGSDGAAVRALAGGSVGLTGVAVDADAGAGAGVIVGRAASDARGVRVDTVPVWAAPSGRGGRRRRGARGPGPGCRHRPPGRHMTERSGARGSEGGDRTSWWSARVCPGFPGTRPSGHRPA